MPPKVLWSKTTVRPIAFPNHDGPTQQIHEWRLFNYEDLDSTGVFLERLDSSSYSEEGRPEIQELFIFKDVVPDLIKALQAYIETKPSP